MDPRRFDAFSRALARPASRRGLLAGFGALLAGARASTATPVCPPGQTANRKGDCSCPAGTEACPDGCFNKKTDLANCGACGRICGGICKKGQCTCTPEPPEVTCAGQCGGTVTGNCGQQVQCQGTPCGDTCCVGCQVCSNGQCCHSSRQVTPTGCCAFNCQSFNPAAGICVGAFDNTCPITC